MSRKLVALRTDKPLPKPLAGLEDKGPERATMDKFFEPLGFKSTLAGAVSAGGRGGGTRRVAPRTLSEPMTKLDGVDFEKDSTLIIQARRRRRSMNSWRRPSRPGSWP